MSSIPLTSAEVNELMDDWFSREGENYVRLPSSTTAHWRPTSLKDSYPTFFARKRKSKAADFVLKESHKVASSHLKVLIPGKRIVLMVNKTNDESYTDGIKVVVSTKMFDETSIDLGEQIDSFLGTALHEGCHVKYTDFSFVPSRNRVIKTLVNILEDERIEWKMLEELPGYVRYMEKFKYFWFDHYFLKEVKPKEEEHVAKGGTISDGSKVINTILRIIRYPKYLETADMELLGTRLYEIRDVLTPYPTSTLEVAEASEKIFEIIKDYFDAVDLEEEKTGDEFLDELLKVLEEMLISPSVGHSDSAEGEPLKSDMVSDLLVRELKGEVERPDDKIIFFKETDNASQYQNSLVRVNRFIGPISKILRYKDKDVIMRVRGLSSGTIDAARIAEAVQGSQQVYEARRHVIAEKLAVCLLIDMSGSMNWGGKIQAARDTAILLNEALKNSHSIKLFIYGHSADREVTGATEIYVFQEPGHVKKKSLGNVRALGNNRDGEAIRIVANRVRSFTQDKCLMFVISDGQPAAYSYDDGVEDTRAATKEITKRGFIPTQIAIEHSVAPETMFDNYIVLTDISNLANQINSFVKKTLMKHQRILEQ
jgi:hypothetical protein